MKISDLKDTADSLARYVFLDDEGLTEACEIIGIIDNRFLVRSLNHQTFLKKRAGYFVGKEGMGIIRFSGVMERVIHIQNMNGNDVYWISPELKDCEVINRRLFNRFQMSYLVPLYFKKDANLIKASLVNLSEGGLRMTVTERLPPNIMHCFEMTLPCGNDSFKFVSDGLVVYCEPESNPENFLTGVTFVAPLFESDEERFQYQQMRFNLGVFLKNHPQCFGLI
ncbi:MAG: hypothetical protein ACD_73C00006G0001 [uncultured bacterium]|nr:MAG: hypothetical protein ACD_73C00006G0001 [uncultured bacterium]